MMRMGFLSLIIYGLVMWQFERVGGIPIKIETTLLKKEEPTKI